MTTFAEALTAYRQRATLSQQALARRAGVYPSEVSRLESGTRHPRRETVEALAGALNLSPLDADLERDRLLLAAGYAPHDLAGMVLAACERLGAIADAAIRWAVARAEHNALRLAIGRRGMPPTMADHLALMAAVNRIDAAARRLHALALPADWRPGVVEQMSLPLEVGA